MPPVPHRSGTTRPDPSVPQPLAVLAVIVTLGVVAVLLTAATSPAVAARDTAVTEPVDDRSAATPTIDLQFNTTTPEAGVPIRFIADPDASADAIDRYEWTFGNDTTRTTTDPTITVTYDAVGKRNVSVTVVETDGTTTTDEAVLDVSDTRRPTAVATANQTNVTQNDTIRFDASASTDNTGITSYEWHFPSGVTRNGTVVEASMLRVGENDVVLVVHDAHGNRALDTVSVRVPDHEPPEIDVTLAQTQIEYGERTDYQTQEFGLGVGVDDVEYDFDGDGEYVSDVVCVGCERIHGTWLGTRTISVRAVDDAGNVGYANATLTVVDTTAPTPAFDANASEDRVVAGDPVTFDANETTDNHRIETYEWDLNGDGTTDVTGKRVTWTFDGPGERTLTLAVTDPSGNEATASATVRVAPASTTASNATATAVGDADERDATTTATPDGRTDATPGFTSLATTLAVVLGLGTAVARARRSRP